MEQKIRTLTRILHPNRIPELVAYLLRDEAISGKLILVATVLALGLANSPLQKLYDHVWHVPFSIGLGSWSLSMDVRHWINQGLMTFFFLVVGLEIKREAVKGELRKLQTALLPIGAAVGGMIVPAILYMSVTAGSDAFRGWAIPMATDIAFAIGLLALLGKRVPSSLKLFLLTLAIVDDIGAIIVIAIFYGTGTNFVMLGLAVVLSLGLLVLRKSRLLTIPLFALIGVALWLALNASGIHASIAGVVLGLLAPVHGTASDKPSLAERIEKHAIPFSTLVVVPLFAFANTGVRFVVHTIPNQAFTAAIGIVLGLVVGKVVGIVAISYVMIKLGISKLPADTTWLHMVGVGLVAGIGFTVSIFVTELAFGGTKQLVDIAKLSIFGASLASGLFGLYVLGRATRAQK